MTAALIAAVMATLGFGLLWRLVVPARPPLAGELARLLGPTPVRSATVTAGSGWVTRLALEADRRRLLSLRLKRDLDLTDQSADWLVLRCLGSALAGGALLACLGVIAVVGGVGLPLSAIGIATVLGGVAGLVLPAAQLRTRASARRESMRLMLPGYLDLTGVLLAAGESLESALRLAGKDHKDWAHAQIQEALYAASLSRHPASQALRDLGERLDVIELAELGDGFLVAEREGASMRASLTARTRGLRERQLAQVETAADKATEGMAFPLVAFVCGFILLIGYPAFVGLSTGLGSR